MDRYLADYLPPVFAEFREFMAITGSEQPMIERIYSETDGILEELFVETAGEYGLSRWEKILGFSPKASESFGERRFRLGALMNSQLPYTRSALERRLAQFCGVGNYSVVIDEKSFSISVFVALGVKSSYEIVRQVLDIMIPANMALYLSLKYNQHSQLSAKTHKELAEFTHNKLRNEVFT